MNNEKLIKVLQAVKYVLQHHENIELDALCHNQLNDYIMLRKSPVNGQLILTECIDSYPGFDLARIKPGIPREVNIINVDNKIQYYRLKTAEKERHDISFVHVDKDFKQNQITFDIPVSRDDYFNHTLMYDLGVSLEALEAIAETGKYLNGNMNVVMITGTKNENSRDYWKVLPIT